MNGRHRKLLYDLRFTTGGVKRWVSKYIIDHYKCSNCGIPFASNVYEWTRHRYGLQLLAYVNHNIIELHIPQMKLSGSMLKLFDYDVGQPTINGLKRRAAELYEDAYEEIKRTLLHGKLIHADETHMNTKSSNGYVWVFTSMEEVIYLWSATREGRLPRSSLKFQRCISLRLLFCVCFKQLCTTEMFDSFDSGFERGCSQGAV